MRTAWANPTDILQFFAWTAARLRQHEKEHGKDAAIKYSQTRLMDLDWHPHWRDEAPDSGTREEFLIRYARAAGVHATADAFMGGLRCRLTKNADDEATITWPGKKG